ncbi:unnamed protein product [Allacma fusca]|uniref:C2H2-type domain-containing protein n=1 Tax=Allacma fusca TaxID=39272 RepID=A0A8J2JQV7_9HEXA|nr:unnamed protein product [Allacma fusca]
MNQLRRNDMRKTGPVACCYCDAYFDHYLALKCHVVKVHPNENKPFLRIKIEKLAVKKDSIANTSKLFTNFSQERRRISRMKKKKLARGIREIKMYPSQRLSIRHEVQRYGEPVLMQSSGISKKSCTNEATCGSTKSLEGFHGLPSFPNACLDANKSVWMPSRREEKMAEFVCKRCSQVFLDSLSLKRHLSSHSKYKTFKCTTCQTNYLNRKKFEEHVARCHQKASSDQECEGTIIGTTKSKDDFVSPHKVTKKALKCILCKKTFSEGRGLNHHIKYVHGNFQTFRCEYCQEQVPVAELGKHVSEHERPYQCKICKKKFGDEKEKCIHERKHLSFGVETHECHKCSKTYFYASSLHRHLATYHQRHRQRVSV